MADFLPRQESENVQPETGSGKVTTERHSKIPVIHEQVKVHKEVAETGKVIISKKVSEEVETVDVPIIREQVDVQRVELNQYVDKAPDVRYEGDTMIIPVIREVVVVEKRLLLAEEIRVTRNKVETLTSEQIKLRKEEIIVERITNDQHKSDPEENITDENK